jgi:Ser/Thr protein kinase RdoA (MazF antagonist)
MLAAEALERWDLGLRQSLEACPDAGLINRTLLVGAPPIAVLQWVNPIFRPEVNLDIEALTRRLEEWGQPTPLLLRCADGSAWVDDPEGGCWRMLSFLPGRTLHRAAGPETLEEAGALVGRFHRAVHGWSPQRHAPLRNIHHTPARMAELEQALSRSAEHPLGAEARALGARILEDWGKWEGALELPLRICHGDLKISNLRFDPAGERAIALLDLDTVGPMSLASEMGDALRSWCNPAGEDRPEEAALDLGCLEASLRGFLREAPPLQPVERDNLVPAIERICLELAARFCADAVNNSYFREDRARFALPGAHNLHRARAQHCLARSARDRRRECEAILAHLG